MALLVFIISIVLAAGIFGYKLYLKYSIDKMGSDLEKARATIEPEIISELTDKLIEAEAESWLVLEQQQPGLRPAHRFATLVGFMLAAGGIPTRADIYDLRYYTIGLSYITGMFKIGRVLNEETFLRIFCNEELDTALS